MKGDRDAMADALVLAGRPNTGALAAVSPEPWEALIDIAGRPMVVRVVDALRQADRVARIAVVGPSGPLGEVLPPGVLVVEAGGTLEENLRRGFAALAPQDRPVLVTACDVPLLTGATVDAFLAACAERPAAFHYPIVERAACEARFPGVRRTYAALREGTFTGGNIFLVAPSVVGPLLDLLERFYAARKSPLRLAWLLGPGILVKFLLRRASIGDVERLFVRLTGQVGRAVIFPHPEVGVDVDKPDDLDLVRRLLAE